MAETIVSPGVLAIENDQSFITQAPVQAGAAIIGPTVKGKVGIPTICTTYSDYLNKFGSTFLSGSQTFTYLTSISAYNYFNKGGNSLLVTRVVSGTFTPATSSTIPTANAATSASATINLTYVSASMASVGSASLNINGITLYFTGSTQTNTTSIIYVNTSSFNNSTVANYVTTSSAIFNVSSSTTNYSSSLQYITSSTSSPNIVLTSINPNGLTGNNYYYVSGSTITFFTGGTNTESFIIETLSEGELMNSSGSLYANGTLSSGTSDNIRWQISAPNVNNGTFTLIVRQGNDSTASPSILESWSNLSLDPFASNYIEKVIGNQVEEVVYDPTTGEYFVQLSGNYINKSRYIRVKKVNYTTPTYFDNTGDAKPQYTGSIPVTSSGVFGSATGKNIPTGVSGAYYENISNTNIQGLIASDYTQSVALLANQDAYKYNLLTAPGLVADPTNFPSHISVITSLINTVQGRGDSMTILDLVGYGSNIVPVTTNALTYDTSYAAAY